MEVRVLSRSVLPAKVLQLFSYCHHICTCGRQNSASAPETDDKRSVTNSPVITIISVGCVTTSAIVYNLSYLSDAVSFSLRIILNFPVTCYDPHSRSVRLFLKWPFLAFPYWVHIRLLRSEYPWKSA